MGILNLEAKILASFVSPLKEAAYPPKIMGDKMTQAIQACQTFPTSSGPGFSVILPGFHRRIAITDGMDIAD